MGHVHFNILCDDLIKRGLRHPADVFQGRGKIEDRDKTETALGDVHCANLSRNVVYFIKQIFMDLGKSPERTDFKCVQQTLLKHLQCFCLADPFLRLCQFSGFGDTQLILQCHKRHPLVLATDFMSILYHKLAFRAIKERRTQLCKSGQEWYSFLSVSIMRFFLQGLSKAPPYPGIL